MSQWKWTRNEDYEIKKEIVFRGAISNALIPVELMEEYEYLIRN